MIYMQRGVLVRGRVGRCRYESTILSVDLAARHGKTTGFEGNRVDQNESRLAFFTASHGALG
jgi:hypothetical protein